ncbi:MAG: HAMP domain-containing protein [Gomphosphaeria aponina SAG 52.96 = DSM 107014]|uniref:HAMP domain-containing protein n=1 Tax=Gomphosphaeria aponina SAG 52.96 = DSM 107014 TaxID=1521640 RepID=A0A941GTG8_9CHRO|nr:HAMP domain-containing protein [Gomphosphaeria aponina SAG 52.96 = DSM 107014]
MVTELERTKKSNQEIGYAEGLRELNLELAEKAIPSPPKNKGKKLTFSLQRFYDLPIGTKQFILVGISVLSFVLFLGAEALVIVINQEQIDVGMLVKDTLITQIVLVFVVIGINLALANILGQSIVKPIQELQKTAEKFTAGDQEARAKVLAADEVGVLANTFNQLAEQTSKSIKEIKEAQERAEAVVEEQSRQNEVIQGELLALLTDVEGASSGNLTVRAEISAGSIGIVADFFNTIVESMREIVTQVKQATTQVNLSLGQDEESMSQLANESLKHSKKIQRMLDFVEEMSLSVQTVAINAAQAAEVASTASMTAQTSGVAMDRTVESILQLRSTVGETAKKVKRLGESSQQISKVISLINQIALQTNLLAINASIEAARAGEEGRGFAVVAEEVGQLAAQSAAATKEIEQIVENIQLETGEVVQAMEVGTAQVVEGTKLVEETKSSLVKIVDVSRQIDELVDSISSATVSQTKTSEMVSNLMKDLAKASERMSNSSSDVSTSIQETVQLAQQLQQSVGTFNVGDLN